MVGIVTMIKEKDVQELLDAGIFLNNEADDSFTSGRPPSTENGALRNGPVEINHIFEGEASTGISDPSTEAFPVFTSSLQEGGDEEEIPFQADQGTTEDQAEFITHTSDLADYGNKNSRLTQIGKPTSSDQKSIPGNESTSLPRRQRGNSNDRSRMRAEEICHENFNFVSEIFSDSKITILICFFRFQSSITNILSVATIDLKLRNGFFMKITTCFRLSSRNI